MADFDTDAGRTYIYPTNYPIRNYQYSIVKSSIFQNTLVCLPTGLGKTYIAAVLMYNFYRWYPTGKIVFMAPTRPLVSQQIEACYKIMGIPQDHTVEMTGSKTPETRSSMWQSRRLFFLTPQVLMNDLSSGICPVKVIKLLVADEAHRALGDHSYCQVIKLLKQQNYSFRVLALSATPGSDIKAVQQVLTNLMISHIELRNEESPDIAEYVHQRKIEKVVIPIEGELKAIMERYFEILKPYIFKLIDQKLVFTRNEKTLTKYQILMAREAFRQNPPIGMSNHVKGIYEGVFSVCTTFYHANELLTMHGIKSFYNFLKESEVRNTNYALKAELRKNQSLKELLESVREKFFASDGSTDGKNSSLRDSEKDVSRTAPLSHPKMKKLLEVILQHFREFHNRNESTRVMIFSQYRDSVQEITKMLEHADPLIKPMSFIGQSSRHIKGITQKEQMRVVREFREGNYNTLISTCVGEEGLDIGEVDLIICYDAPKSPIRLVQRMGRTGRKREGRIIVLVTQGKEEKDYNQSQYQKRSLVNAITAKGGKLSSYLYTNCPRMIPDGINPECLKLHMNVPEWTTSCQQNSAKRKKKSSIGAYFAKAENTEKDGNLLTDIELRDYEDKFRIDDEFVIRHIPQPKFNEVYRKGPDAVAEANCNEIDLGIYQPWYTTLQPCFEASHSKQTKHLVDLTDFISVQEALGDNNCYEMEMAPFLDQSLFKNPAGQQEAVPEAENTAKKVLKKGNAKMKKNISVSKNVITSFLHSKATQLHQEEVSRSSKDKKCENTKGEEEIFNDSVEFIDEKCNETSDNKKNADQHSFVQLDKIGDNSAPFINLGDVYLMDQKLQIMDCFFQFPPVNRPPVLIRTPPHFTCLKDEIGALCLNLPDIIDNLSPLLEEETTKEKENLCIFQKLILSDKKKEDSNIAVMGESINDPSFCLVDSGIMEVSTEHNLNLVGRAQHSGQGYRYNQDSLVQNLSAKCPVDRINNNYQGTEPLLPDKRDNHMDIDILEPHDVNSSTSAAPATPQRPSSILLSQSQSKNICVKDTLLCKTLDINQSPILPVKCSFSKNQSSLYTSTPVPQNSKQTLKVTSIDVTPIAATTKISNNFASSRHHLQNNSENCFVQRRKDLYGSNSRYVSAFDKSKSDKRQCDIINFHLSIDDDDFFSNIDIDALVKNDIAMTSNSDQLPVRKEQGSDTVIEMAQVQRENNPSETVGNFENHLKPRANNLKNDSQKGVRKMDRSAHDPSLLSITQVIDIVNEPSVVKSSLQQKLDAKSEQSSSRFEKQKPKLFPSSDKVCKIVKNLTDDFEKSIFENANLRAETAAASQANTRELFRKPKHFNKSKADAGWLDCSHTNSLGGISASLLETKPTPRHLHWGLDSLSDDDDDDDHLVKNTLTKSRRESDIKRGCENLKNSTKCNRNSVKANVKEVCSSNIADIEDEQNKKHLSTAKTCTFLNETNEINFGNGGQIVGVTNLDSRLRRKASESTDTCKVKLDRSLKETEKSIERNTVKKDGAIINNNAVNSAEECIGKDDFLDMSDDIFDQLDDIIALENEYERKKQEKEMVVDDKKDRIILSSKFTKNFIVHKMSTTPKGTLGVDIHKSTTQTTQTRVKNRTSGVPLTELTVKLHEPALLSQRQSDPKGNGCKTPSTLSSDTSVGDPVIGLSFMDSPVIVKKKNKCNVVDSDDDFDDDDGKPNIKNGRSNKITDKRGTTSKLCTSLSDDDDDDFKASDLKSFKEKLKLVEPALEEKLKRNKDTNNCQLLHLEADVSRDLSVVISSDEDEGNLDRYEESFVDDETQAVSADVDMQAVYLQSVRSPLQKMKANKQLTENVVNHTRSTSSTEEDSDDDSFVVANDYVEYDTEYMGETMLAMDPIVNKAVIDAYASKKGNKLNEVMKKRKRIVMNISSDEDKNESFQTLKKVRFSDSIISKNHSHGLEASDCAHHGDSSRRAIIKNQTDVDIIKAKSQSPAKNCTGTSVRENEANSYLDKVNFNILVSLSDDDSDGNYLEVSKRNVDEVADKTELVKSDPDAALRTAQNVTHSLKTVTSSLFSTDKINDSVTPRKAPPIVLASKSPKFLFKRRLSQKIIGTSDSALTDNLISPITPVSQVSDTSDTGSESSKGIQSASRLPVLTYNRHKSQDSCSSRISAARNAEEATAEATSSFQQDGNQPTSSYANYAVRSRETNLANRQKQDNICILVDSAEVSVAGLTCASLRMMHNVQTYITQLNPATYVISSRMAVYRIQYSAFASSANRSKLVSRVRSLLNCYDRPVIIVEKDGKSNVNPVPRTFYVDTISCAFSQIPQLRVLYTEGQSSTVEILWELICQENIKGHCIPKFPADNPHIEQAIQFYRTVPRITCCSAMFLALNFRTIKESVNSNVETLMRKGRMSAETATSFLSHFSRTFRKDMVPSLCESDPL